MKSPSRFRAFGIVVVAMLTALIVQGAYQAMSAPSDRLKALLTNCKDDHVRFAHSILGGGEMWSKQREVCRSVRDHHTTVVPAGNGVGKSFVGSRIVCSYLYSEPNTLVFTSAPSQSQLEGVLWKEIRRIHKNSRIPLGGRIHGSSPIILDNGEGWMAYGHVSNSVERMSGHHAKRLLAVIDEASGVSDAVYEAVDSLNPSRRLLIGNPLRPSGTFFDLCRRADDGDRLVNKIVIPSTDSPDIHLERSPRGMADATWIEAMKSQYGEASMWWLSHVLALFPGEADDALIMRSWLDLAGKAIHVPSGPVRMAIDLGLGLGNGDRTVIIVRDDNGLLEFEHSRTWSLEAAASRAAMLAQKHEIAHRRISFDAGGIGNDFGNRLEAVGIKGAQPYLGGRTGPRGNFRSVSAWLARLRLDPDHWVPSSHGSTVKVKQHPFAIRPEWLTQMRAELEGLRYALNRLGLIELETKEDYQARIKHSPDFADAFTQSFAFLG